MSPPRAGEECGPIARSCGARRAAGRRPGERAAGQPASAALPGSHGAGRRRRLPGGRAPFLHSPPPRLGPRVACAGRGGPAPKFPSAGQAAPMRRTAAGRRPDALPCARIVAPAGRDVKPRVRRGGHAMPMPSQYTTSMPVCRASLGHPKPRGRPAGQVPLPDSVRRPARGSASGWSLPAGPVPLPDSMARVPRAMSPPRHPLSTQCRLCGALPRPRRCRMRPRPQTAPRKERRPGGARSGAGRRVSRAETRTGSCAGRRQTPWPRSCFPAGHRRAGPKWSARCHRRGGRPACAPNAIPGHRSARQTP